MVVGQTAIAGIPPFEAVGMNLTEEAIDTPSQHLGYRDKQESRFDTAKPRLDHEIYAYWPPESPQAKGPQCLSLERASHWRSSC